MTKVAPSPPGNVLPREERFKPRGAVSGSRRGKWRALALVLVHVGFVAHFAHWKFAGETVTPLEPSESMQTFELGYVNAGFLLFATAIVATLLVGRFLCGWLCHFVAYQDLCAWLLGKLGLRPRPVRSRLLQAGPFVLAFYMFAWPSLARWWAEQPAPDWEFALTKVRYWETFPGPLMAVLTILVDGFLLVWWLGAKGFCTYGCPYGAVFGVVDRFATGRIRVTDACETCGHCTAVCTSNVRVHEEVARHGMVVDPGCMKCLDCTSACPTDALYFGFGKIPLLAAKPKRKRPSADFTWPEEIAMAVVASLAFFALRGAYDKVPVLLAIGLAALAAVATIVLVRFATRRELRFQHTDLRRDGRATRAGVGAIVLSVGFLTFVAHTGVVQYVTTTARAMANAGASRKLPKEERTQRLGEARAWLATAESLGLFGDSALQQTKGLVLRELEEFDGAEAAFRRAVALHDDPAWPNALVPLADVRMVRGDREGAVELLRQVLAEHPGYGPAVERLQRLQR